MILNHYYHPLENYWKNQINKNERTNQMNVHFKVDKWADNGRFAIYGEPEKRNELDLDPQLFLWKDSTIHKASTGYSEVGHDFDKAYGYWATREEAATFLIGYVVQQNLQEEYPELFENVYDPFTVGEIPEKFGIDPWFTGDDFDVSEPDDDFIGDDIDNGLEELDESNEVEITEDVPDDRCLADGGCSALEDCYPDYVPPRRVIKVGDQFVNEGSNRIITRIMGDKWGIIGQDFYVYMVGTREVIQKWVNECMIYVGKAEYKERPENVH